MKTAKIPRPSAQRFLAVFREAGLLRVLRERAGRRPAFYVFSRLLNIAEGKEVF